MFTEKETADLMKEMRRGYSFVEKNIDKTIDVVNLHAEHKTVKRREKKGRNVERLNISGFRV